MMRHLDPENAKNPGDSGTEQRGVLAKGVSAGSSVTRRSKQKVLKDIGPGSTFGTQRATAIR